MATFTIEVTSRSLAESLARINRLDSRSQLRAESHLDAMMFKLHRLSVQSAPVRTGFHKTHIRFGRFGRYGRQVHAAAPYAAFINLGTGRQGAASGVPSVPGYSYGATLGQRANPHMLRAWDTVRPELLQRLSRTIREGAR